MNIALLRNFSYLSLSLVAANLFGYLFHAVVSRDLGPVLYGEFSVMYALMITLSAPVSIMSGAITRVAVTGRMAGSRFAQIELFACKSGILSALAISLGPAALSPLIGPFLNLQGMSLFIPVAATLFWWGLSAALKGLFSSTESFGLLACAGTAELFIRAGAGIALVAAGFGASGALWSSCVGAAAAFALLYSRRNGIAADYERMKGHGGESGGFVSVTAKVFFIAVPTGLFLELDLLLARRYFDPADAGIFAAVALLGKGILLFSTAASSVLFPRLVRERLSSEGIRAFLWGVIATLLLFGSGILMMGLFGEEVVRLLFGGQYLGAVELAPYYMLSLMPLALHLQVTNYKGAIGGWVEGLWLWSVLAVYYLALDLSAGAFASYLRAVFVVHAVAAPVSLYILYLRQKGSGVPARADRDAS